MKIFLRLLIILSLSLAFSCDRIEREITEGEDYPAATGSSDAAALAAAQHNALKAKEQPDSDHNLAVEIKDVAAGLEHFFAITENNIFGWGANDSWQLWPSKLKFWDDPREAGADIRSLAVSKIFLGAKVSFLLDEAGRLFSWGNGAVNNPDGDEPTSFGYLKLINFLPPLKNIALGSSHVLALSTDGKVFIWGSNSLGQLGYSQVDTNDTVVADKFKNSENLFYQHPRQIKTLPKIVALAAGEGHSLALDDNGQVWSWGLSTFAALGTDVIGATVRLPVRLNSPHQIEVNISSIPLPITDLPENVDKIAAGTAHSLALINGDVYSWGLNETGQLGRVTTEKRSYPYYTITTNGLVSTKLEQIKVGSTPEKIIGLPTIKDVVSKGNSSFALSAAGKVYFWGYRSVKNAAENVTPVLLEELINLNVVSLTPIDTESLFLLDDRGKLYRWGLSRQFTQIEFPTNSPANDQPEQTPSGVAATAGPAAIPANPATNAPPATEQVTVNSNGQQQSVPPNPISQRTTRDSNPPPLPPEGSALSE